MKNYPKSKKLLTFVSILMLFCVITAVIKVTAVQQEQLKITKAVFEKRNVLFAKFQQNLVQILLRNVTSKVQDSNAAQSHPVPGRRPVKLTRQATVQ